MQGIKRKIVYVTLFELIAVAVTTVAFAAYSGQGAGHSTFLAVASSLIATVWNLSYNTAFEKWESRQKVRGRGLKRRLAHAFGFETGLTVMLVPLFAWWLKVSLWEALILDVGLIVFFLVYAFLFNLWFDRVFGLPASAQPLPEPSPAVTASSVIPN
ncbi:PACE efflux transporter [Ottowia thiooxydans]|uniref:PACE efflux transporter n=1 Tax=Ottowia thiooxydans TaxID=219182 RepID=UPI0003FC5C1F|nr:PACE efflux transporter [Ottowia thiooxydans]